MRRVQTTLIKYKAYSVTHRTTCNIALVEQDDSHVERPDHQREE